MYKLNPDIILKHDKGYNISAEKFRQVPYCEKAYGKVIIIKYIIILTALNTKYQSFK